MAVSWIAFHLTDRCQLDCQHCLRDPGLTPKDLPLPLIRKILAEARTIYQSGHVALTGGEPTLHPEFAGVIDAIVENGFNWHLVTNGRRIEQLLAMVKEVPARREKLSVIDFSLDGADEETHDSIRGKGSFREVMLGATLCQAYGIPFILQSVINAKNVHQIEAFGMLAANLKAQKVLFAMLQPTGTHLDRELYLSPHEWRRVHERIQRLTTVLKIEVCTPEGFEAAQSFHLCEPWKSQQLHVDVTGKLNLCCQHSGIPGDGTRTDVAGDLNEMSLIEAHGNLLKIIHQAQMDKLERLKAGPPSEWERFPCNDCLKYFGKPHWDDQGAAGPEAKRDRWRGAWAKTRLPVVS
jgi:MoaA/NifB/PqqE/SkfB family radical SAM enzyme